MIFDEENIVRHRIAQNFENRDSLNVTMYIKNSLKYNK